MSVKTISAIEAHRMMTEDGAVLVDVRERHEITREHIEGAIELPLTGLRHGDLTGAKGRKAIFFCHSGGRTRMYGGQIEAKAAGVCDPYVLGGGILAWRRAGFPTVQGPKPPSMFKRLFGGGSEP
ncbi:rhodanese-related sulfurtransferase [Rhodopseudomonas thermotolerans]|jgi:rhodanese-related sulfurtransferase|uniref:Rhodanese-related sulfurtransferase n=2 Tax=Rhodopseudomonas TaxID=1073 RepID=A0A336JPM1_9BRAD|nr:MULTISPECIES: rhodanese-like domain-containing protein [Rhodopseudomonas]RED32013.1 rhodanese-related sulfurtransferase [Rhodopseudomonas pentothenatexigens]REF93394.1 rhodanese-related sulfurtransferase [Rhodopseudomonas thermotolerans]SSW91685.1 rhodanese-related sulfurtransferase [Rhodopseudomonas pentothenatexigens]